MSKTSKNSGSRRFQKYGDASERGWRTAFEIGEAYTREQTDRWKDELSNLLIVAGLFSAVVTSFLVQTLSSLQQGPADITNQLLAQISAQLGSFSVTPGYINTTAPAAQTTTAFVPTRSAVNVNGLWAVSLLLSLLTAFVAIAAQQWLRHLYIPRHVPVREAARLQCWRQENLDIGKVGGIIWVLPTLLQLSIILFLLGFLIFLDTLNTRITVICAVTFGLFVYQIVKIECFALASDGKAPWKSAFIPASFTVILWCLWMLLEFPFLVIFYSFWAIAKRTQRKRFPRYQQRLQSFGSSFAWLLWRSKFVGPLFYTAEAVASTSYWRVAEGRRLAKLNPKSRSGWDASALALALSNVTHYGQLRALKGCLSDMTIAMRIRAILIAMWRCSQGLQLPPSDPGFAIHPAATNIQPLNTQTLDRLVRAECAPYFALLEQCVRVDWRRYPLLVHPDADGNNALYVSSALAILYQSGYYSEHDLVHLLVSICATMVEHSATASSRVPYILLYKICTGDAHTLSKRALCRIHNVALDRLRTEAYSDNVKSDELWTRASSVEVSMASACTALYTATRLSQRKKGSLRAIIRNLVTFLERTVKEVNEVLDIIIRQPPQNCTYLITPEALAHVCDALVVLAERRHLPLRLGIHCSSLRLKEKLDALCNGRSEDIFVRCRDRLRRFGELCIRNLEERPNASDVDEDRLIENGLTSLVLAERMLVDGIEGGSTEV